MKDGKASEPNGLSLDAVRLFSRRSLKKLPTYLEGCLGKADCQVTKNVEVMLIPNGNGECRPTCLISTIAKGLENIVAE